MHSELYTQAAAIAREAGVIGVSVLQRELSIDYVQASILMQNLQVDGLLSKADEHGQCKWIGKAVK